MTYIQVVFSDGSIKEFPMPDGIDPTTHVVECNIIEEQVTCKVCGRNLHDEAQKDFHLCTRCGMP